MSGKAGLIVGGRGAGKTTLAKSMLSKVSPAARLVYDVNAEYRDLYPEPFLEFDEFTSKVNRAHNAFILIEESTIFLSTRGNNFDIRSALVKARHNNNTFILVFHSLRSVPVYILTLCDFIVLLKTGDTSDDVNKKFNTPALTSAFNELQALPRDRHPYRIIKLLGN